MNDGFNYALDAAVQHFSRPDAEPVWHGGTVHPPSVSHASDSNQFGPGAYFGGRGVADEWAANRPGGSVKPYHVGLSNPFDERSVDHNHPSHAKMIQSLSAATGMTPDRVKADYGGLGTLDHFRKIIGRRSNDDKSAFPGGNQIGQMVRDAGFDGIVSRFQDGLQHVAFNDAQIKPHAHVAEFARDDAAKPVEPWQMLRKHFDRNYMQHSVLHAGATPEEVENGIRENGFSQGVGPNVMLPTAGEPTNIIQRNYGTKAGVPVIAVPKLHTQQGGNGARVKTGWKFEGGHIGVPESDYEPLHRIVVRTALAAGKPVPPEVLAEHPDLVKTKLESEFARKKPAAGQKGFDFGDDEPPAPPVASGSGGFDEHKINREHEAHDGKRPGEFAPKETPEAKPDEPEAEGPLWYGMKHRPPAPGAIPKGNYDHKPHPDFRHGQISYGRPLTEDEQRSYELSPIHEDAHLPALAKRVGAEMGEHAPEYAKPENDDILNDRLGHEDVRKMGHFDRDKLKAEIRSQFGEKAGASQSAEKNPWEITREEWLETPDGKSALATAESEVRKQEEERYKGRLRKSLTASEKHSAESRINAIRTEPLEGFASRQAELLAMGTYSGGGHHDIVKNALSDGREVPPHVLADYPDLVSPQSETPKSSETNPAADIFPSLADDLPKEEAKPAQSLSDLRSAHKSALAAIDAKLDETTKRLGSEKSRLQRSSGSGKAAKIEALESQWQQAKDAASDEKTKLSGEFMKSMDAHPDWQAEKAKTGATAKAHQAERAKADEELSKAHDSESWQNVQSAGGYDAVKKSIESDIRSLSSRLARTGDANKWKLDSNLANKKRELERLETLNQKNAAVAEQFPSLKDDIKPVADKAEPAATPWHADRPEVFEAMRNLNDKVSREWEKARDLAPRGGTMGVGGADFDHTLKASVGEEYLRTLRKGGTPAEALAAAEKAGRDSVKAWNEKTSKGRVSINSRHELKRWEGAGDSHALGFHQAFNGLDKKPAQSAPASQSESGDWSPENHLKIAADSIDKLRGQDIYRLLDSAPPARRQQMATYIRKHRPEFSSDIHDAQLEVESDRNGAKQDKYWDEVPENASFGERFQKHKSKGKDDFSSRIHAIADHLNAKGAGVTPDEIHRNFHNHFISELGEKSTDDDVRKAFEDSVNPKGLKPHMSEYWMDKAPSMPIRSPHGTIISGSDLSRQESDMEGRRRDLSNHADDLDKRAKIMKAVGNEEFASQLSGKAEEIRKKVASNRLLFSEAKAQEASYKEQEAAEAKEKRRWRDANNSEHPHTAKALAKELNLPRWGLGLVKSVRKDGWFTNGRIALKLTDKTRNAVLKDIPEHPDESGSHSPDVQKIISQTHSHSEPMQELGIRQSRTSDKKNSKGMYDLTNQVLLADEKGHYANVSGKELSTIQSEYPKATFHAPTKFGGPVTVKSGGDVVAMLMPMTSDGENNDNEDALEHIKKHRNGGKLSESPKEFSRAHQGCRSNLIAAIHSCLNQDGKHKPDESVDTQIPESPAQLNPHVTEVLQALAAQDPDVKEALGEYLASCAG